MLQLHVCRTMPPSRMCFRPAQVTGETGQRGWAEGAPAQALAGLSAAYAEVVQPSNKMKVRAVVAVAGQLLVVCVCGCGAAPPQDAGASRFMCAGLCCPSSPMPAL